ncbi:cytoskeletal protein binding protein [Serendipita sp. 401]|nr:cytoskeletal protein binding protein [Serendipita sp. 401]
MLSYFFPSTNSQATPISTVKAAYDYEASAAGELTITEGEVLQVHERDEEWILVEAKGDKPNSHKVGYVPANYVEEGDGGEEEASSASVPSASAIVIPDSPPRPAYMAPEERTAAVAASSDKSKQDPIEIWPVSLLDKKGKKKKGTLGVGNGAVFFTSESDKSPVQKWQSSDIAECTLDSKAKQIQIDFDNAESLKFISKDAAEAIHRKIESSRAAADSSTPRTTMEESRFSTDSRAIINPQTPRAMDVVSPPPSEPALSLGRPADPPKSVHFAAHASEIPPRPESPDDEDDYQGADGENAVALYDFVGDANDELTVKEGEAVWILDRSNDDWWKCRNQQGHEGVVPAQYLELEVSDGEQENQKAQQSQVRSAVSGGTGAAANAAAAAAAAASRAKQPSPEPEPEPEDQTDSEEERERERERLAKEKKEKERKEKERRRAEREREEREREEEEARAAEEERRAAAKKKAEDKRARAAAAAHQAKQDQEDAARKRKQESSKTHRKSQSGQEPDTDEEAEDPKLAGEVHKIIVGRQINKDNQRQNTGRPDSSATRHGPPPTGKTRVWHDRTGQFRVEAEFKGYENGKIRLHKLNGVTIEVPASKMSAEDMRFIEKFTGKSTSTANDEDVPLGSLSRAAPAIAPPKQLSIPPQSSSRSARSDPSQRKPTVDWFEFFLNAGCDMDDCTRYTQAFERDKIDETILPDMKQDTLRALGLREGDIIRVMKVIEKRGSMGLRKNELPGVKEQIQADENYAHQLQEAILTGKTPPPPPGPLPTKTPSAPAPNLFAGPRGALKDNTRRGRPAPSNSRQTSINVDETALASASSQLGNSPTVATPGTFNRTPSPNLIDVNSNTASNATTKSGFDDDPWIIRPSSAKPTSPVIAVSPPAAPASAPPAPAPPAVARTATPAVATLSTASLEVPQRPATTSPAIEALTQELELLKKIAELKRPPSAPAPSLQAPVPPSIQPQATATPLSFNSLAAAASAPFPPQQTGVYNNSLSVANGVRGPFAPVPANESVLLKPLIPTNTAMSGFIPTRPNPTGVGPQPMLSQATGLPQLSPFQAQPQPSPFQAQPQPSFLQPQFTAFQPQPMMMQRTGIPTLSPVMMQQTGSPFGYGSTPSPVPPVPSIPSQFATGQPMSFNPQPITTQPLGMLNFGAPPSASPPPADHSPANVFVSMKSGNFGGQEHAAPNAPNYDALRANPGVNPLASQPTGWVSGMPTGYQYR